MLRRVKFAQQKQREVRLKVGKQGKMGGEQIGAAKKTGGSIEGTDTFLEHKKIEKYWAALQETDDDLGSSGDEFDRQSSCKVRGHPGAENRQERRLSNNNGTSLNRAIADLDHFYEDCEAIYNFLKTGVNIYPTGMNIR